MITVTTYGFIINLTTSRLSSAYDISFHAIKKIKQEQLIKREKKAIELIFKEVTAFT